MQLDYVPSTGAFTLMVPRQNAEGLSVDTLMTEYGLDFSQPASTSHTACLFTREPYAAASFYEVATERARTQLGSLLHEIAESWRDTSGAHIRCPPGRELWGFQKAGVEYAMRRRNTLIGDQPGLGKTPSAICLANEMNARRVLVICPANIRLQWARRITEWSTMPYPYHIHCALAARHGINSEAAWNVVSYDLARTTGIGSALAKEAWDLLILDEAHYLKTSDSQRTRALFGGGEHRTFGAIADRASAVLALTGTPLPNRPREAYTLARSLCWDSIDWLSEERFKERFNPSMRMEKYDPITKRTTVWNKEESGRHAELQNRLRSHFMVRHLKRDVMPQLKMPVYDIITLEDDGAAIRAALQAESLLKIDPEHLEGADATILGHVAAVRRMMGIAMAPRVADYIDMLIDGGEEKLVVFAWHIEVLNILQKAWQKHGVIRIDGSDNATSKDRKVREFVKNPSKQVILGNLLSMGVGTDGLQEVAYHGLIAEPDWTPGNNIQAFDRLDRGGQGRTVQGDIFVVRNSLAERVLASALRKLQTTHKALDRRFTD